MANAFTFKAQTVKEIPAATRKNRTSKYDAAWSEAAKKGITAFGPFDPNTANALRQRLVQLAEQNKVDMTVVTRVADDGEQRMVYAEV